VSAASCERRSRSPNNAVRNSPAGETPKTPRRQTPNRRWMSDVLTPKAPRAACRRFPEGPRTGLIAGCVYSVRRRFSAPAHSTHAEARWSAVVQPAISTFQRHGTQHLLHCRPPSSFHLVPMWPCVDSCSGPVTSYYLDFARARAPRGVPSGFVQRTGCGACGLGHPHQVWWAPPMYIARAWCLAPVSSAGMSTYLRLQAPRAFAQVFAHCRFV
jgi:hypothetical protein